MSNKSNPVKRIKTDYVERYNKAATRQTKQKKRLRNRLIFFGLVMTVTFMFLLSYHIKQRDLYVEKKSQFDSLTEQMEQLTKEEQALQEELELLKDDEYILDLARSNYFLSKKGELIFQIIDE